MRIGIGVDAHRRVSGRKLVLGGVELPAEFGLAAHSDGDVIAHAILDALFGAAALGDKGRFFPPTDPAYHNISSLVLLQECRKTLADYDFEIENIDVSVMCEEPQLAPYVPEMVRQLGLALALDERRISVKGTTLERMGFTGRNEGIAALAVALVKGLE
ncbi:2-C-methyl-D-erythritol 2,4-cyclodiphosphate synthase [candidate division KSB1 bacterium]|nr:2-C-methyl-D-erythritol 2,4-cyclodiphosphate synthase [candidate division KSB1 bacterium]